MTSQLDVANLALAHLAIGRPISAIDEATQPARVMRQFYPQARDEVLRDFNWPFARKFATLVRVATNPTPDWPYSFRYPDDCLFVRDAYAGSRRPLATPGANLISYPDDLATAPWARLSGTLTSATNNANNVGGRRFSRISNATTGVYGQALTLSVDGSYRARISVKQDASVTGTFTIGLYDSTLATALLFVVITIPASGPITAVATSGTLVASAAEGSGIYGFEFAFSGVIASHSNSWLAAGGVSVTAASYQLSEVQLFAGTSGGRTPYIVGRDDSGRLIYAGVAPLQIEYTVGDTDEDTWPPDFVAALSFLLAWYASATLTAGDPHKLGERAKAAYQEALSRAQLAGENEQEEDLAVANLALLHLGVGRPEMPPDEQVRAMRAVRQMYAQVRDETFRERNWPFARKYASLTNVAGPTPRASTDFAYSYRYPTDCLAARVLRNGPRRPLAGVRVPSAFDPSQFPLAPEARVPFIVGQDSTGRLILTDAEPVAATSTFAAFPELEYTVLVDQSMWPADFLAAVAARLAWQAAPFVVKGDARSLRERVRQEYEMAISRAWGTHVMEQEADPEPDSSFISSRY